MEAMDSLLAGLAIEVGSSISSAKDSEILFKEGDVVCEYVPYVWTLLPEFVSLHCYRCGFNPDPLKPKRCSGCQYAHYCLKECQTVDWKDRHKMECKILSHKIISFLPGASRPTWIMAYAAIARLAEETRINNGVKSTLPLPVNMEEAVGSLGGSPLCAFSIVYCQKDLFDLCDPKRSIIESDPNVGAESFTKVFGAVRQLALPLQGYNSAIPGGSRENMLIIGGQLPVAVTPPFREVLRGCTVNVLVRHEIWDRASPPKSVARAVKDIREGDPLMGALEPRFTTWKSRKAHLATVGMTCACKACADPHYQAEQYALKCTNVECSRATPFDGRAKQPCSSCGTDNSQRFKEAKEVIDDMSKWLDIPEGQAAPMNGIVLGIKVIPKVSVLRQQIIRGTELLHPTNLLLGKACFDYCDWLRNSKKDNSPDYLPFLKRIIPAIESHSNKYDYMTRNVYSDIVRAHVKRNEYGDAQPYMDTLAKRLELTLADEKAEAKWKLQSVKAAAVELRKSRPNGKMVLKALEETSTGRSPKIYRTLE